MRKLPEQSVKIDLSTLNSTQREAVQATDGPVLVLAGAGTGKTRVITYRIAWLIGQGVAPSSVLAATFTNKAAREMKERIAAMVPAKAAEQVSASTFHSFGARLLRRYITRLGYSNRFDIAGESYTDGVIRSLSAELGLTQHRGKPTPAWKQLISRAKSSLFEVTDIENDPEQWPPGFALLYRRYLVRMKSMNVLDFDDLLGLVIKLWRECPDVLEICRRQYRYLLLDEYQDTNHAQFVLSSMLAEPLNNICAVGDDDQSIYGWRGAAVGNILEFQDRFPGTKVIRLEQNYRSTNTILAAANEVIANNPSRHYKALWSNSGEGDKIFIVKAADESEEARFAADLVRERHAVRGGSLSDFAVLYRSNHLSRSLEQAFRQAGIPYSVVGSKSFYHRKEIIDALSFLHLVWNPHDDQSLLRVLNVPPRGIGEKSIERLNELQSSSGMPLQKLLASRHYLDELPAAAGQAAVEFNACLARYRQRFRQSMDLAADIRGYLRDIGYLDGLARIYKPRKDAVKRRENVLELINSAAEFTATADRGQADLGRFLELFALRDDNDRTSGNPENSVSLMTVHGAKGLEFPVVTVVGLEHELFPHYNSLQEGGLEEERRLFYVAATRACEELYLSYASRRYVGGSPKRRRVSPFVKEIPVCYTVETDPANIFKPVSAEAAADYLAQMKAMFSPPDGNC